MLDCMKDPLCVYRLCNRLCNKCNLNAVEDEIHCLILCPSNSISRDHLFNVTKRYITNLDNLDNADKFKAIMTSKEPEMIMELGKFLLIADV